MIGSLVLLVLLLAGMSIGALVLLRRWGADRTHPPGARFADSRGVGHRPGALGSSAGKQFIERRSGRIIEHLMKIGNIGFFDWNLQTGTVGLGGSWMSMLGYREDQVRPGALRDPWLRLCHESDLPSVQRQLHQLIHGGREVLSCALRMHSAKDAWQWMHMDARAVEWQADGTARRILGTLVDIDVAKRTEHVLASERRLFFSGPVVLLAFEAEAPHRLRYFSPNLREAGCFPADRLPFGLPLEALLHPEDAASVSTLIAPQSGTTRGRSQVEVRLARSDGRWPWHLMHLSGERSADGSLQYAYMVDINRLKEVQSRASAQNESLQDSVRKMAATQRFMQILQQFTELLQLCDSEEESRQVIELGGAQLFPRWSGAITVAGSNGAMELLASWGRPFQSGHSNEDDCWAVRRGRLHQCGKLGSDGPSLSPVCGHFGGGASLPAGIEHAICAPLLMGFDRPGALHLVAYETENEDGLRAAAWGAVTLANALKLSLANLRLRTSLREQAVHDEMTELYNRRYFDEALNRELSRSKRTGEGLILAIMDIDHFKNFNDTFGHEAGDTVIRTVAEHLRGFVRAYDIACRVGGEELAIIMPRVHIEEARVRLERLRAEINTCASTHKGVQLPTITVSVGVADLHSGPPEDLVHRADAALYASKHNGRNRLTCWEPGLEED